MIEATISINDIVTLTETFAYTGIIRGAYEGVLHLFLNSAVTSAPLDSTDGAIRQIITIKVFGKQVYRGKINMDVSSTIHFSFYEATAPTDGNGVVTITYEIENVPTSVPL